MVVVKNIRQDGDLVHYDYYPKGMEPHGHCVYNFVTNEIVSKVTVSPYDDSIESSLHKSILIVLRAIDKQSDKTNLKFDRELIGRWS